MRNRPPRRPLPTRKVLSLSSEWLLKCNKGCQVGPSTIRAFISRHMTYLRTGTHAAGVLK